MLRRINCETQPVGSLCLCFLCTCTAHPIPKCNLSLSLLHGSLLMFLLMSPFPTNSNQFSKLPASPPPSFQPSHFKDFSQPLLPQFPNSLHKLTLLPVFLILAVPDYNNYSSLSAQLSFSWLSCHQPSSLLTLLAQFTFNCPLTVSSLAQLSFSCNSLLFSLCSISFLHQLSSLTLVSDLIFYHLAPNPLFSASAGIL